MPTINPIPYQSGFEIAEEDEAETLAGLKEVVGKIITTTYEDTNHGWRGAHAKSHGVIEGEMEVFDNLPDVYAQGAFSRGKKYPVLIRFSTAPADILDDDVAAPRGFALKIGGVEGERLPGSEKNDTQDFLMVDGPAFVTRSGKSFLSNFKLLAATVDKGESLKKALSAALRGVEATLEAAGAGSAKVKTMGGHPKTHILGETFFTQVPVMYGPYMAKLCGSPVTPELKALKDAPVDDDGRPDYLRHAVSENFARYGAEWEIKVQLCTNLETMPIEDASVEWLEDQSPYVPVARIRAAPQESWSAERAKLLDDGSSFSPWHGITAHRPLGSIMRLRKEVYELSADFRFEKNGCPFQSGSMPSKQSSESAQS